jgi:hypothetical protein
MYSVLYNRACRDESRQALLYKTEYIPAMISGKPVLSLQRVLGGTDAASVSTLFK